MVAAVCPTRHRAQEHGGTVTGFPHTRPITAAELLTLDVEVVVPAASPSPTSSGPRTSLYGLRQPTGEALSARSWIHGLEAPV